MSTGRVFLEEGKANVKVWRQQRRKGEGSSTGPGGGVTFIPAGQGNH